MCHRLCPVSLAPRRARRQHARGQRSQRRAQHGMFGLPGLTGGLTRDRCPPSLISECAWQGPIATTACQYFLMPMSGTSLGRDTVGTWALPS